MRSVFRLRNPSFWAAVLLTLGAILIPQSATAASVQQTLFWDFENATTIGPGISESIGLSSSPAITGFVSQTGGGPAENFGVGLSIVFVTRFFGSEHPFIEFTTNVPITLKNLEFQHLHNHTPGYANTPYYDVQLQIDTGSGFTDIGAPLTVSAANYGAMDSISLGSTGVAPGTYQIRWDARNFANPPPYDTNTDYFALNDVTLSVVEVRSVGGAVYPVNKITLLAPWIALSVAIVAGSIYLLRRRVNN